MVNKFLLLVDGTKMLAKVLGTLSISLLVIFLSLSLILAISAYLITVFGYIPTVLLFSMTWLIGLILVTQYKPN